MSKEMVCSRCGTVGKPVRRAALGFGSEMATWIAGLFLALLFGWWIMLLPLGISVYRMATNVLRCPGCNAIELVPPDSPAGREMQARYAKPLVDRGLPPFPPSRQPER